MSAPPGGDDPPLISVLTPSFNQGAFLPRCIESVLAQGYQNFEHIIYDNCSRDGTLAVLRRYPHLIWSSRPDRGQSDALNHALCRARGEIIAWINADDRYEPGAFAAAARELHRGSGHMVMVGRIRVVDAAGRLQRVTTPHFAGHDALVRFWAEPHGLSQPGMLFRREALARVGLLDPRLHYAMDYDLWLRLAEHFPFKLVQNVLATFTLHPESKTGRALYLAGFREEMERVSRRYWGSRLRRRYWTLRRGCNRCLADLLVRALLHARKHEGRLDWNVLRDLARRRPILLFSRHVLAALRGPGRPRRNRQDADPIRTASVRRERHSRRAGRSRANPLACGFDTPLSHADARESLPAASGQVASAASLGRVSVVIPTYNRAGLVGRAVASALRQTVRDRCDIIVVDDGSTDETADVLRCFGDQIIPVRQRHAGVSAARNTGIRTRANEFVAFLDSDDEWSPQLVERQLAALARHPAVVFVAAHGQRRAADGRTWAFELPAIPRGEPVDLAPPLFERLFLLTSGVMVRSRALAQAGLFPTCLARGEDHVLWVRLACRGPALFLDEPLVTCGWHAPRSLADDAARVAAAQLRVRDLLRRELRRRPDCRAAWRRGLVSLLSHLRDQAWRQHRPAAAARLGFRALLVAPRGRARWEWGQLLRAGLACAGLVPTAPAKNPANYVARCSP